MAPITRPQPYRLDPPVNSDNLPQIVTNTDEMFQILFEDLAALETVVTALATTVATLATRVTASPATTIFIREEVETDGLLIPGPQGVPGPQGPIGPPGVDGESIEEEIFRGPM